MRELIDFINVKTRRTFLSNYTGIEYNISHSSKWVTCSIDNLPVEIDIEQIKPINTSIAQRFFSKEEVKSLIISSSFFFTNLSFNYIISVLTIKVNISKNIQKTVVKWQVFC
ncbi:hypothetical protein [Ruminiclostridium cellobioparum]|uniref:hypothetical protein n=1 Tax=Ruminiclostridium cellobioparum TaxID=29355 RepID=UPI0028AE2D63|nr:hypothetical protein [Ruminiclostridium cellobioparum]